MIWKYEKKNYYYDESSIHHKQEVLGWLVAPMVRYTVGGQRFTGVS